jgi:hypothetical protein
VTAKKWWGKTSFNDGEIKIWTIGDRKIAIQRLAKEWLVWNEETSFESTAAINLKGLKTINTLGEHPFSRHLFTQTDEHLNISLLMADRAIVARPASKLNIPPGQHVALYVSTPLWFVGKQDNCEFPIVDLPFWRPSDSWFGSSTMVGELCYAKYTEARVDLANLKKRPHRAITSVLINNQHDEPLTIERINLPAPFLGLYANAENQFWSDQIEITHNSNKDKSGLKINKLPLIEKQSNLEVISTARIELSDNHFIRSIKSLLA